MCVSPTHSQATLAPTTLLDFPSTQCSLPGRPLPSVPQVAALPNTLVEEGFAVPCTTASLRRVSDSFAPRSAHPNSAIASGFQPSFTQHSGWRALAVPPDESSPAMVVPAASTVPVVRPNLPPAPSLLPTRPALWQTLFTASVARRLLTQPPAALRSSTFFGVRVWQIQRLAPITVSVSTAQLAALRYPESVVAAIEHACYLESGTASRLGLSTQGTEATLPNALSCSKHRHFMEVELADPNQQVSAEIDASLPMDLQALLVQVQAHARSLRAKLPRCAPGTAVLHGRRLAHSL